MIAHLPTPRSSDEITGSRFYDDYTWDPRRAAYVPPPHLNTTEHPYFIKTYMRTYQDGRIPGLSSRVHREDYHVGMPRQIYQDDHIHYDQRAEHRRRSYPKEESREHREYREEYDPYYQSRVA